jgi:hypothetical protein
MTYSKLIEDCKDIYIEFSFSARWMRIEMFHRIAKLVLQEDIEPAKMTNIANQIGIKPVDLAIGILLVQKYPNLNDLPAGKNISWSKIADYL